MTKKKTSKPAATWTLLAASIELGVSRESIRRGLRDANIKPKPEYSMRELFTALSGDLEFEQTRLTRAKSEKLEAENNRRRNETIQYAEADRLWSECVILPLRERLLSLPTTLDVMCNSEKPSVAREALRSWMVETLNLLRDKIPREARA